VHEIFRSWRRLCRGYDPERVLVGETWFFDVNRLAAYCGADDEMQPCWALGNHDVSRSVTRWCGGDERKARLALTMLLILRGAPFLYQGDEIALADQPVPPERLPDPLDLRIRGQGRGRDPERTPMPWSPGPGAVVTLDFNRWEAGIE
jgi:glycosidase